MKRIILFSLIAFSLTASAQRRRIVEPVFDITPEEAMAQYDFDKAEEILNAKIELENDADICCNDITEWLKIRIPRAAMPHRVEFGRLTTTSIGKICNRQK